MPPKSMPRFNQATWWAAGLALALVALAAIYFLTRGRSDSPTGTEATVDGERLVEEEEVPTRAVELYFPGEGGRLYAESREIADVGTLEELMAAVAAAVIEGPHTESLRAPLPADLTVEKVYALGGGAFALGLETPGQENLAGSGSRRELLTLYSLVNSVLTNFDQADSLVLLVNGRQPSTFTGHIDTSRPLIANPALVAQSP